MNRQRIVAVQQHISTPVAYSYNKQLDLEIVGRLPLSEISPEQEAVCERLEKGESTPNAAALIRQQAHEIDDLWDRLSRAYALVRDEFPSRDDPRRDEATPGYA